MNEETILKNLIKKIQYVIDLDGEEITDGECLDEIIDALEEAKQSIKEIEGIG